MKMDIKSIEWDRSNGKKVRIDPSFISAAKDVVGGTGGYSGEFGDEEASMLWFDGKGVAHLKKVVQELLKIPKALMERLRRWTCSTSFLSSDRRGAYLFIFLSELETRLVSKPTVRSKS